MNEKIAYMYDIEPTDSAPNLDWAILLGMEIEGFLCPSVYALE